MNASSLRKSCSFPVAAAAGCIVSALLLAAPPAHAIVIAEYDSGAGSPLSPTTQGWTASQVIEEGDPPPPTLATVVDTTGNAALANAGAGATGWIVRDYLDGAADGQDDRPEYNMALSAGDFSMMQSGGWTFTATFMMDNDLNFNQEMRVLSLDQGGGGALPFDIKVNGTYIGDVQGGNLGLSILGGGGEVDTGVPAEQFNTVVLNDADGDGTFTIRVNGNLLNGGATFDSNPSDGDVPGDDVIVFGANSTGGDGGGIEYDLVRLEAGDAPVVIGLTIDRDDGNLTLTNSTAAARSIVGYKITSADGALDSGAWTSIADAYDAGGNQSVDNNDEWVELTAAGSRTDLSEFEPDGDGGTLAAGASIDLGNVWIRNPNEGDMAAELLLSDGTVEPVIVSFVDGPNNAAFEFGDIDFDGDFDVDDFTGTFVPGFGANTSGMSAAEQYQAGDFNSDGTVDEFDFLIFNDAFLEANPGAGSLSFPSIPEPTTSMICAAIGLLAASRFRSRRLDIAILLLAALALTGLQAEDASAQANIIAHWSFDETSGTTLTDSEGTHNGTAMDGLTGSANAGQIGNAWDFAGGFLEVANPSDFTSLTADYSFSMWFNTTAGGPAVMWSVSDSTTGSEEALIRINDFAPEGTAGGVHYMGRPNVSQAVSTSAVNDNQWHHVVATQSSTGFELYVDGVLDISGPAVHSPALIGADTVRIGQNVDSGGGQWGYTGLLDDLSIWDAPLTSSEVEELYLKGLAGIAAPDPFSAILSLEVDEGSGAVTLMNDSGLPFDIDLYRVSSPGDSLNSSGWSSLDEGGFDGNVWTQLADGDGKVSEGAFGDSSVLADGMSMSLGSLYDTGINAKDLVFEYHLAGTDPGLLVSGEVTYVDPPGLCGDSNGDGIVNTLDIDPFVLALTDADQYAIDFPGVNFLANNDINMDGVVNTLDIDLFVAKLTGGAAAAPEPSGAMLAIGLGAGVGLWARRRGRVASQRRSSHKISAAVIALVSAISIFSSAAATTIDRDYRLGDDPAEAAVGGNNVGAATGGVTFDSEGTVGMGDLQDLQVNGSPTYVSVSNRPGAGALDLGVSFDGAGDHLITTISMNSPSNMWDNTTFFPTTPFPNNYEGIFAHGIQLWARPDQSAFGLSNRQGLVFDTFEHGIVITEDDTWALWYDQDDGGLGLNPEVDSGVSVAGTLDGNGWAHVMQLAGLDEPVDGGSSNNGVLLVNGVAVAARAGGYDADSTELVVGAALDPDNLGSVIDHYDGDLDDVRLLFWGDNTGQDSGDGRLGQNWGPLDLAEDNDWIRQQLQALGVTDSADVNLDGSVSGDGSGPAATDDVTAFVDNWLSTRIVNGVQVGDWVSRQQGDLNFDGIVDLVDAFELRSALVGAGTGSFDFGLLVSGSVPEPSAFVLIAAAGALAASRRRADCS